MKITKGSIEYDVSPTERIDHLDGPWWLWACDVSDGGEEMSGSIEGDGHIWAAETLEIERKDLN